MRQQVLIFHKYLGNYVTYKYVLYIIKKVFSQRFCSCLLHNICAEIDEKSQVIDRGFYTHLCPCVYGNLLNFFFLFKYGFTYKMVDI